MLNVIFFLPIGQHQTYSHREDRQQPARNGSCPCQTLIIHVEVYLSGCTHVVNTAVTVTLCQVVADRVEVVVLL